MAQTNMTHAGMAQSAAADLEATAELRAADGRVSAARSVASRRYRRLVVILVVALLVVATASLSLGDFVIAPFDLLRTLVGAGDGGQSFVLFQLRMPRVVLAVLAGAGFAVSGALFQSVLRNPLASPDIIGVTGGASAAAVLALLVLGLGTVATSLFAFGGAVAVAAAIYLLAWRGGVSGYRFVLIGVGVAFMVNGVVAYLLTRADLRSAQEALAWLVGSVADAQWSQLGVLVVALVLLSPLTIGVARRLRVLQLGEETAHALGVPTGRTRAWVILLAVAFAAVSTAVTGPIAFVAFVSAPIARRSLGDGSLAIIPAALVGAVITATADLVAQHLLPGGLQLPAGIVTGVIGAPYLLFLLASSNRRGRGA